MPTGPRIVPAQLRRFHSTASLFSPIAASVANAGQRDCARRRHKVRVNGGETLGAPPIVRSSTGRRSVAAGRCRVRRTGGVRWPHNDGAVDGRTAGVANDDGQQRADGDDLSGLQHDEDDDVTELISRLRSRFYTAKIVGYVLAYLAGPLHKQHIAAMLTADRRLRNFCYQS